MSIFSKHLEKRILNERTKIAPKQQGANQSNHLTGSNPDAIGNSDEKWKSDLDYKSRYSYFEFLNRVLPYFKKIRRSNLRPSIFYIEHFSDFINYADIHSICIGFDRRYVKALFNCAKFSMAIISTHVYEMNLSENREKLIDGLYDYLEGVEYYHIKCKKDLLNEASIIRKKVNILHDTFRTIIKKIVLSKQKRTATIDVADCHVHRNNSEILKSEVSAGNETTDETETTLGNFIRDIVPKKYRDKDGQILTDDKGKVSKDLEKRIKKHLERFRKFIIKVPQANQYIQRKSSHGRTGKHMYKTVDLQKLHDTYPDKGIW